MPLPSSELYRLTVTGACQSQAADFRPVPWHILWDDPRLWHREDKDTAAVRESSFVYLISYHLKITFYLSLVLQGSCTRWRWVLCGVWGAFTSAHGGWSTAQQQLVSELSRGKKRGLKVQISTTGGRMRRILEEEKLQEPSRRAQGCGEGR